uniref:DNA polymerase delta subunit 3 n=1 Tax=Zea mays TaxID=4577 RepID=A0A804QLC2_MAIZE
MAGEAVDQSLLHLLPQIHALFSDPLRVISYKWLSRNFSVSSNDAKRLLQEFVDKHGTDLQVIYSVSGWLKSNPENYCVKLVSGPKLEARHGFKDSCSVQIYSIQACIPKDTAVLWNHEFVQAEELFNQPFDDENCLRDNRFCGVLNSFVKRTSNGKHVSSLPPKPLNSAAVVEQSKPSVTPKEQFVTAQQQDLLVSSKHGAGNKSEKDNSTLLDKAGNAPVVKEQSIDAHASKSRAHNGKTMPNNGGSLANMWGRASTKPKPPSTTNSTVVESVAATLDAQICAKEEADGNSSDDEQGIKYKRESTNANNRKRRAVFDFSDDEEDENIISIASPEVLKQRTPDPVIETAEDAEVNQKNLENKDDVPNTEKGSSMGVDSDFTSECKTKTVNTMNHSGITLKEKSSDPPVSNKKQDSAVEPASTAPKRRKVLKTRIDERGREVTEAVWEGEGSADDKAEKNVSTTAASGATLPSKPKPATSTDQIKAPSKTAAGNKKPAKAKAGTKQGSIMSFFKKA